jgi:hypothetical protein
LRSPFAGLHTLEEMSSDYFQPFFASVIPVKVSFLSRGAVDQVLANPPDPEFALDYEREALDDIYELDQRAAVPGATDRASAGQPVQHTLTFEQGKAQEPRFRRADVEAVITTDFYRPGALLLHRCVGAGAAWRAGAADHPALPGVAPRRAAACPAV